MDYVIRISSGTKTVILNEAIYHFCIESGILYFSLATANGFNNKIYVLALQPSATAGAGKEKQSTATDNQNPSANPRTIPGIYKTTDCEVITFPYEVFEFNVKNGVIYAFSNITAVWRNPSGKDGIWRVNRDGSGLKQIYTGNAMGLQIVAGTIYFEENMIVYQMDLEGKQVEVMGDMSVFYMPE